MAQFFLKKPANLNGVFQSRQREKERPVQRSCPPSSLSFELVHSGTENEKRQESGAEETSRS